MCPIDQKRQFRTPTGTIPFVPLDGNENRDENVNDDDDGDEASDQDAFRREVGIRRAAFTQTNRDFLAQNSNTRPDRHLRGVSVSVSSQSRFDLTGTCRNEPGRERERDYLSDWPADCRVLAAAKTPLNGMGNGRISAGTHRFEFILRNRMMAPLA